VRRSAAHLLRGISVVYANHGSGEEAQRLRSRSAELDAANQQSPEIPLSAYGR
jgi:hypothetical protein